MKKVPKGSVFCMVKARNDQKKLEREVGIDKQEIVKHESGSKQKGTDASNAEKNPTRRKNRSYKPADTGPVVDCESESRKSSKQKKESGKPESASQGTSRASYVSNTSRGRKTPSVKVIDVDAEEVIEIPDEEPKYTAADHSNKRHGTRQNVIEIEDEDDCLLVDEDLGSSKSKKRRKRKKDKTQKKQQICEAHAILVDEDKPIKKKKKDEGQTSEVMSQRSKEVDSSGCSSQFEDRLNLNDQAVQLIAELDELCCLAVKDDILLVMNHPCVLTIKGRARFQCLAGAVQIMGYDLNTSHPAMDLYSPDSNSLITMATTQCGSVADINLVVERVKKADENQGRMLETVLKRKGSSVIVRVQQLKSQMCDVLTNHNLFYNLFETHPDCEINVMLQRSGISVYGPTDDNYSVLYFGEGIQSLISQWNLTISQSKSGASIDSREQPVILLCGAKNSGKSTTNRLLVNNALNSLDSLYFLDCDIGQSEFTPPGCISLVKVTEPVFGPPFTHQITPECSYYFGAVTPTDDPSGFVDCVQKCVQYYKSLDQSAPLIVNTMGWIEDLGLQLLVDTIRLVEPSYLVQLQAKHNDQLPDMLHTKRSWTDMSNKKISKVNHSRRNTKQMYIEAEVNKRESKYSSVDLRTLTTLSYLCKSLEPGLSLYSVSPYRVGWKDVAVHVCHKEVPRQQIMYALNASLVALCEADLTKTIQPDETGPKFFLRAPSFKWIGYGIIRGIDPVQKRFVVITPLTQEELQSVNTIVKGSALLPEQLLMEQDCENVPYVDGRISSFGEKGLKQRRQKAQNRKNISIP